MAGAFEEQELKDRLSLIENMIAEGRHTTESWGWMFLLWGVAYYVAAAWAAWGRSGLAWPVTMIAASLVTAASRMTRNRPGTALGRSIGAVWIAMGISLFLVLMSLGISGRYEPHTFIAIVGAMLGMANATSGIILKWKMQLACAVVWWTAATVACFGPQSQSSITFLAATFFCQIVFGIYALVLESRRRRQSGAVHA